MKVCKRAKSDKVGEVSSKYGYPGGGKQFIRDCQAREARYNYLWTEFVEFMHSHDVNPAELRAMFV